MKEKLNHFFDGKKVLILGFGREGRSTLDLIKEFNCMIGIADQNLAVTPELEQYELFTGEKYLDAISGYDIVMKSPGIALFDKISEKDTAKITGQTDLLLKFCENKIIGVTGTKGKSTTSSLVHHILEHSGKKSVLIGNIGIPPLSIVDSIEKDTIIVCEMSCHQLEYVQASPNIAVLLNIYEEHLDHYVDFDAYKRAKENIYRFQNCNDVLIYNRECHTNELDAVPSKKISASQNEKADIYISGKDITLYGKTIPYEKIAPKLEGEHNLYNIAIALVAAKECRCELEASIEAIRSFNGLEHRMELVRTLNGVKYINDSISTIPLATINAVKAFSADTVIIGGMDRGINYDVLVEYLNTGTVTNIICLPDSGYRIADMLDTVSEVFLVSDMEEAVGKAYEVTKKCCILSPAAASYGFYKNFEERGKHFKELVNKLQI